MRLAELVPPIFRQSLIEDEAFSASLGLVTDGVISFEPSGVGFPRNRLMGAVHASSTSEQPIMAADQEGEVWSVRFVRDNPPPCVVLEKGAEVLHVRHLGLLSERLADRERMLDAESARVNLPVAAQARWRAIIAERGLTVAEVSDFADDIKFTPVAVSGAIASTLHQDSVPFDMLVPRSADYYERLVGRWQGQATVADYVQTVLPEFLDSLLAYDEEAGFRLSLLLASHPLVLDAIAAKPISSAVFQRIAQWAGQGGDAMTRCAILELAIQRDDHSEETKAELAKIGSSLLHPQDGADDDFELLSAAFILVYGQLAYLKILNDRPSFWRRLAALAQAGLLVRCFSARRSPLGTFAYDLRKARARPFALRVYADMRLGPKWQAQDAFPSQLRNEFVGRVVSRAALHEAAVQNLGLHELILGESESLKSSVNLFLMLRAGPLEDNVPLAQELNGEQLAAVEAGLAEAMPTALSFAPLVNSVSVFRQSIELADKAAAALQRAQYRLDADKPEIFLSALWGLASCAAVNRSVALADAVFTVIRTYRRLSPELLDLNDAVRIGMIACASREEMTQWIEAVGGFLAEFAYQSLTRDEAEALEFYIRDFCDLMPELWGPCGSALAAAESVIA